ncbi:DNA topoisomerase III [Bacillus subtilis]|uniref:DNA topoisomerase n=1 Tax=Bacillus subtilis TaxID=1423 RepID=UPI000F5403C2|nr:DNA topoisomerase [Bacillus subtilis]MEC2297165.1 DNA topoisomerase [Bacillus subtilis]RPJ98165.1 DNA topoisomerase III [Bacillus subtilis]
MKELFVCEKPNQAQDYAAALSGNYEKKNGYFLGEDGKVFTYALGHLVELKGPEQLNWKSDLDTLPYFEKNMELALIENKKKQYFVIVDLMKKAETVIISTDSGREGEHIFRKIYKLSGLNKPLKRLWVKDNTESGIKKAYSQLRDGSEYEGLAKAGQLRDEADFLVGVNATILATRLSSSRTPISLGRVQTPTLSMIVKRDYTIENFKKVEHFTLSASVKKQGIGNFELLLEKDQQLTKADAESILTALGNRVDLRFDEKVEKEKPKQLFDLTSLQIEMNKKVGWSAKKTLDILQGLYEKHKVVTYPRTSSKFVASTEEFPALLEQHKDQPLIAHILENKYEIEKTFVNPGKVTDHEAIIITKQKPKSLGKEEELLYDVIFKRFVAAFYPPAVYQKTSAEFSDGEHVFKSNEKVLIEKGWRSIYDAEIHKPILKDINLDDIDDYELKRKETKPPKRYDEGTLLNDMENAHKFVSEAKDKKLIKEAGIGTSATRADIIEVLCKRNFIERQTVKNKEVLVSTPLGRSVISMMPEDFLLYSPKMTAIFESMLGDVEENNLSPSEFYAELENLVYGIAKQIRENIKSLESETEKEVIANCPNCGREMYENQKAYSCSGYQDGCKTVLWKNSLEKLGKKSIGKAEAKKLLAGESIKVKLKSKAGNPYEKRVIFNKEKYWVEFCEEEDPTEKEVIANCPNCGREMYENQKAYSCSGYQDGCKTVLWKNGLEKMGKKKIGKTEAKKLLAGNRVKVKLNSKKTGKSYEKEVIFNKEKNWIVFAD